MAPRLCLLIGTIVLLTLCSTNNTCHGWLPAGPVWQEETPPQQPQLTDEDLVLRKLLEDPREAMRTFLSAMDSGDLDQAIKCLDLDWQDKDTASAKGGTYADQLYFVIIRIWDRRSYRVSGNPNFQPPYQLSEAVLEAQDSEKWIDARQIQLTKNSKGMWRFSQSTLETVEQELWPKWQDRLADGEIAPKALSAPVWVASLFPKSLREKRFLLKDYQWICLLLLTAFGFLVGWLSRLLLDLLTQLWFGITKTSVDDQPRTMLWRPFSLLINALVWYFGAKLLDLPAGFLGVLLVGLKFFSVVIAVWTAFRAINLLANFMVKRAARTPSRYDDSIVPIASNLLKFAAVLIGVILFVDVFQLDWKTVLGGFGVGGIALALASKEILSNFLGSITVLTDRPFEIGDSVVIDGKVAGTVETVGMRSSRIRTYNSSEVIVPNSLLTTAIVDNLGRRKMRRMKTMLQIDYDTPVDRIEAFCAGIRQMIQNSQYTRKEGSYVFLNEFGECSINILVYVYIDTTEYETELRARHCLLSDILRLAEEMQVRFAFPTRTLHLKTDGDDIDLPAGIADLGEFGRSIANRISKGNG